MQISDIELESPDILNIPPVLIPLIKNFNDYSYFLLEGGRASGKTHTVARWLMYLAEKHHALRIVCGRETMASVDESVYTVLADLVRKYDLNFEVLQSKINHKSSGSAFRFRGFREQGAGNVKGMESVNLLWIDEAQFITKDTLDIIIPTIIRNTNFRIIFTMNRFLRNDPVWERFADNKNCLVIKCNYTDNPFCTQDVIAEAEECKRRDERDYRHIWLGEPLDKAEDYLFNFSKLDRMDKIEPFGTSASVGRKVMSVDFAGGGGDMCVASLLEQVSNVHWRLVDQRAWADPDTDLSVGKTVAFKSLWQPDLVIVDAGGFGYPMYVSLSKSIPSVIGFDGSKTDFLSPNAANHRAEAYLSLKEFTDQEWLIIKNNPALKKEMETIKRKFKASGAIYMQSKDDMKREGVHSPDRSDSLAMGVFAIRHHIGKVGGESAINIKRVNTRRG